MEWVNSFIPADTSYNITLFLSFLSCEEQTWPTGAAGVLEDVNSAESIVEISQKEEDGILDIIVNFFASPEVEKVQQSTCVSNENNELKSYYENHCQPLIHFYSSQTVSLFYLSLIGAIFAAVLLLTLLWFLLKLCKSKPEVVENVCNHHQPLTAETEQEQNVNIGSEVCKTESKEAVNSEAPNKDVLDLPLIINIQEADVQEFENVTHRPSLESLFEKTLDNFLKDLDHSLNSELGLPSESGDGRTNRVAMSSYSDASLTSPLLARRNLRPGANTVNIPGQRKTNETSSKYWIYFQKFRRHTSWTYPDVNFDHFKSEEFSQSHTGLSSLIQFFHQMCSVRPRQWNAATLIVDYILFLLECELTVLFQEARQFFVFTGFEGTGSAANGTQSGTVDRFEVLFTLGMSRCSEIIILHNKCHEAIPPGHVIIGAKINRNPEQMESSRKMCIQGLSGFYLLPQRIEELAGLMIKKAVLKLSRDHKNKTDRLPFKFQMPSNKTLVLSFDTKLLQGLGLGVSEITVKITPTVRIYVPQFGILPPLNAVPHKRNGQVPNQNFGLAPGNFFNRIIRDESVTDLLWEVDTAKLQTIIMQNIENKFFLSGVRSYHKECLVILKGLFSKSDENNLLNKGEIDECILDTVVSFLLQESPPLAWTFSSLTDRVSDAVHFLKSAYGNRLLPKFLLHNPHLLKQIPSLHCMTSILSGHQQNLLTGISNDAAMKVVEYVGKRLQETGLSKCLKPEFSSQMWEYEFYLFG